MGPTTCVSQEYTNTLNAYIPEIDSFLDKIKVTQTGAML